MVVDEKLRFKDLPANFNKLKIVQISDIHLGIYYKHSKELYEVVKKINQQNPDLVFFTGDAVNNISEEVLPFIPILNQINAKIGKYAILGNHDYGDYYLWKNDSLRSEDAKKLIYYLDSAGFTLLNNSNTRIARGIDTIVIAGTENYSPPPFRQVGNLDKTLSGMKKSDFVLMMTHNPEFWKEKFLPLTNVKATFSGHTHGMQLSLSRNWSPLNITGKPIAGLIEMNGRYLYINRGLGGGIFAGRIGMWPEITVFTLLRE
jgi:predicted MPP superfamily phosphohydrolase